MKRSTVWAVYWVGFMSSAILWLHIGHAAALVSASCLCAALCGVLYLRCRVDERETRRP